MLSIIFFKLNFYLINFQNSPGDINNVEMEARLQLAEARISAKLKAEEENTSIPQTIAYKIVSLKNISRKK